MHDHELLIDALCAEVWPIRRPAAAASRALAWSLICLVVGWITTMPLHFPLARLGVNGLFGLVNVATSLPTGALLLIAAFETSIPGRKTYSLPAAVFFMATWAIASLVDLATASWPSGHLGEGVFCFRFILFACAPMTIGVVFALRRTYSIRPMRSTALGTSGTAFLAFALLALCHHGRLYLFDFSMHLAAVTLIIAASTLVGSRFVAIPLGNGGGPRARHGALRT